MDTEILQQILEKVNQLDATNSKIDQISKILTTTNGKIEQLNIQLTETKTALEKLNKKVELNHMDVTSRLGSFTFNKWPQQRFIK